MIFTIHHVYGRELWSCEAESLRDAVEKAVVAGASLDGASLDGASLDGARLDGARLDGARLDGARLDGASLDGASLVGASLDGASLDGASLVGARLVGASLVGASLVGASLDVASLDGASLVGARLDGARLDVARLDPIRNDLYAVLDLAKAEVPGLLAALRAGRVDGSTYEGECACLVGTIANVRGVAHDALIDLRPNASRPSEVWFIAIRKGDTPDNSVIAKITEAWIVAWMEQNGQVSTADSTESAPKRVRKVSRLRRQVSEFHKSFGQPIAKRPIVPADDRVRLRLRLIAEEFFELLDATLNVQSSYLYESLKSCVDSAPIRVDLIEVADALADLDYVVEGTRLEFGIHGSPVADEVHRSNMTKLGPDGKPIRREDGKVTKPEGWTPPDIAGVLAAQGKW